MDANNLRKLEKLLSHLFFFFFTFQIFSPFVGGVTIYLECLIAIINPFFLKWLFNFSNRKESVFIISFIIFPILFGQLGSCVKYLYLVISILFLIYTYTRNIFFFYYYLSISILVAIIQFVLTFIHPEIAYLIGPTNLANLIWGPYATPTFTNFYTIFFFPRVSGLSREAGFFASLIIVAISLLIFEKKAKNNYHRPLFLKWLIGIGFIISFSKMSLVLFPILVLYKSRQLTRHIPYYFAIFFIVILFTIIFYHSSYLLNPENVTFLHRFGAYAYLPNLSFGDLLFGSNNLSCISSSQDVYYNKLINLFYNSFGKSENFAGLGGVLIQKGIIFIICFFYFLRRLGMTTYGVIFLLLTTLNTSPDTGQNFVILSFMTIYIFLRKKSIKQRKHLT